MSRIIVKNLPKKITEQKIREIFAQKGEITDIQMKFNKDGVFRSFAFIGFRSEDQAKSAQEYFNNNYVQTSKIRVEVCDKEQNKETTTTPSKDEQESESDHPKDIGIKSVKNEFEELMQKPEFQEFLKVQRNIGKQKAIWDDDVIMDEVITKFKKEETNDSSLKDKKSSKVDKKADQTNDDDHPKSVVAVKKPKNKKEHKFNLAIRNIPAKKRNKADLRTFFAPIELCNIRFPLTKSVAYVSFHTEQDMRAALVKHKSFLGKKQVLLQPTNSKDSTDPKLEFNRIKNRLEKSVPIENIEQTGRLFVRNLSYGCTREDLETLFNKYGPTVEVTLPVDTETEKIKGFAFITYVFPEHAMKAFSELDRSTFQGRLLHVIPAEARTNDAYNQMPHDSSSSFKKRKTDELKSQATRSHNWNALFLSANAVADILTSKLNIKKSELLMNNVNNKDSLAARMALGETQLVQETKRFLEQNNVCLDSFDSGDMKRSRTVMLVKNLPANTTEEEMKKLVNKFGKVKRLLMPPYGATAIVEYNSDAVAYQAFQKLAYMKFKRVPLYLEWAPINVFRKESEQEDRTEVGEDVSSSKNKKQKTSESKEEKAEENDKPEVTEEMKDEEQEEEEEKEEDQQPEPNTVLYVKNLNALTSSTVLKQHFAQCGKVFKATIAEKKNPDGTLSSMGYGFVQYYRQNDAKKALRKLELTKLEGNPLNVKLSSNTLTNQSSEKKNANKNQSKLKASTKIIVKNVPFEASEKDLTQLFRPFGQLQSVRLPKKLIGSGSHRGFAFVEYSLKTEAKKAMDTIQASTHLYGRRLVLDWAKTDQD